MRFRSFVPFFLRLFGLRLRLNHLFLFNHRLHGWLRLDFRRRSGRWRRWWWWRQQLDHRHLFDFRRGAATAQELNSQKADRGEQGEADQEADCEAKSLQKADLFILVGIPELRHSGGLLRKRFRGETNLADSQTSK